MAAARSKDLHNGQIIENSKQREPSDCAVQQWAHATLQQNWGQITHLCGIILKCHILPLGSFNPMRREITLVPFKGTSVNAENPRHFESEGHVDKDLELCMSNEHGL